MKKLLFIIAVLSVFITGCENKKSGLGNYATVDRNPSPIELAIPVICDTLRYPVREIEEDYRFDYLGVRCFAEPAIGFTDVVWNPTNFRFANRPALSLTTTGTGVSSYNPATNVMNIPNNSVKMGVPYSGTTNASGVYSVTYGSAYATVPNVQGIFVTSDPRDVVMLTSSTTTGFSFTVQRRVDAIGLLPTYTNRTGVTVNALVTPN